MVRKLLISRKLQNANIYKLVLLITKNVNMKSSATVVASNVYNKTDRAKESTSSSVLQYLGPIKFTREQQLMILIINISYKYPMFRCYQG